MLRMTPKAHNVHGSSSGLSFHSNDEWGRKRSEKVKIKINTRIKRNLKIRQQKKKKNKKKKKRKRRLKLIHTQKMNLMIF